MVALSIVTCETYASSLQNSSIDVEIKVKIVSELRDSIEIVQSLEYPRVLALLMPAFQQLLVETPPVFLSTSPQQKLRNIILEIIHRFPFNEVLKPYSPELIPLLLQILRNDNEENAVICLKILNEMYKNYHDVVEDQVQPFLDIVKEMYGNMAQAIEDTFNNPTASSATSAQPVSPAVDSSDDTQRQLAPSRFSFKVLTECPIIIALLFSLYKNPNRLVSGNVPQFIPLVMNVLTLQPEAQRRAHQEAAQSNTIFCGVSPEIKNRAAYSDFKALQVKTLSFIAYILRMFQTTLRPHEDTIADVIVQILKDCPPEAAATRKEMLVATRHIWYSDFRAGFTRHIDALINEDVLIGKGVTCRESLRPLAYSVLVDLILHVRAELSRQQISRIIHIYSKKLLDTSFVPNIQIVCAKLLCNMIDCLIDTTGTNREGRTLLIRILDAYSRKFTALSLSFPSIIKAHMKKKSVSNSIQESLSYNLDIDGFLDLGYVQPIKTATRMLDTFPDIVAESRALIKNLIQGVKPILQALRQYNPAAPLNSDLETYNSVARGFSEDEVEIFVRIFKDGLKCFEYYNSDNYGPDGLLLEKPPQSLSKDDKEAFEKFAAIFTGVEPCVFQEVLSSQMPLLFERILINPGLQAIPQYLLGLVNTAPNFHNAAPNFVAVAPSFAGLLCRFLVDKIEMLGSDDHVFSATMLRLFKVVFMAVTKYPDKNEVVLRPHVGVIITKSMKLASKSKDPINFFQLLRGLFRSIGGGRFEQLYQEVLPLLEVLLEGLTGLIASAHKPQMKDLFVELCLTVPVRLSALLPYLSYLMKPLVLALRAGPDLVSQGLRTLELCIDNLTQDFLEPIINPVVNDLMAALRIHLQPLPYNKIEHSHATMRILGKLGGRNRRYIGETLKVDSHPSLENGIECLFNFNNSDRSQVLVLDKLLPAAHAILGNPSSSKFYVEQAFIFAKSCLPLLIDLDNCSIDESTLSHLVGKLREDMAMEIDVDDQPSPEPSPFIEPLALPRAKKEAFDDMLRMTISLFFAATTFVDVRDAALDVISNLCYQFAHVSVAEALEDSLKAKKKQKGTQVDNFVNSPVTRSDGFIDAIVESFCSESADQRKYAEKALQTFANACKSLLSSWPNFCIDDMSVFHTFASRFCSCCYQQEWFKKSGGCHGISFLCSQLDLTPKWIIDHELEFVKALLFILKDASPEMASTNTEDATLTLSHVLKVCNNRPKDESETPQPQDPKFNSLVSLLISELSNSNATVRETIQSTFQLLADLTGTDVTSMLNLVRDRLLQPIFAKPLRALPFAMQIGNIDAITFCLQLRPPMLEFSDELVRLLHEALALADAEDQALVSNKPNPNRNITSLTNLRVVCIRLLATAMICPEFMNARHTSLRSRIISVFFKSMYVKSPEINQAAYKGLQKVLSHQFKLPKDLLQAGLRPILVNLGDYKRLSVVALDGLARLLELLTNYFKVEIGRKLLDHMRHWAEPAALEDASGKPLSEIEAVKILVAIVNVFHLLPATANIFFDDLVKSVLDLEMLIKRNISSPFRAPLIKYLNRYPTETVGYFLERMGMPSYGKLFFCVLRSEHAVAVRQEVINDPAKIIQRCFPPENNPTNDYLSFCGVQITQEILTYVPDWLHQNPELLVKLREHWDRVLTRSTESVETPNMFLNEYQCILEIFVNICRQETFDIDVLFEIIKALTSPELVDVTFVKHFIYQDVIVGFSPAKKKGVLKHFFRNWTNFSMDLRTSALRFMIIPMLLPMFTQNDLHLIIDSEMINLTHTCVWQPFLTESIQDSAVVDDAFKVELLQLTTLLVRFAPSVINELRKEVIKFAWNHLLKVEDVTCKQAAYVLLARFIEQFDTPTKIVIQIFVALLRSQQHEGRVLVKQALNILIPVLPRRLPSTAADLRVPLWVRWTRKIIVEDGHSLPQLVTIYQLLIRHADLFYKSKDHFIPNIISSLARLGLSPLATPETKSLSIELGDLILQWDRKRLTEMDSADDSQMEDPGNMSRIGYREMLLGYFIRFVCTSAAGDSSAAANFIGKSVEIIKSNLEVSPDIPVKFSHFEKALPIELKEENAPIASNAADLLNIIMERKPAAWISANLGFIQKCIESWIRYESASVVMSLQPIFQKIHQLIHSEASKDDPPAEVASFTKLTESVISKGLQSMTNPLGVLSILSAAYEFRPTGLEDKVIENLLKLFQKLTTEFCAEGPSDPANPVESKSGMIQMALSFIKVALPHMKEHRKGYLECLSQLIIEGSDIKVLYRILELVKWWILESSEPFPTAKEKANLMVKLLAIEGKNEKPLIVDYLSLVLQIYTTPAFARTELTVRLEKAFLWGTRFEEPELRRKFCDIFSISVEPYLHSRLYYIVGVQNWEHISSHFWIKQAVDLLLGSISVNERLLNCVPGYRVGCEMRIEDGMLVDTEQKMDVDLEESSPKMQHVKFIESLKELYLKDMLLAVREFVYVDTALASHLWTTLFPICWNLLHPNERQLLTKMFVPLLAKEYHTKQADLRPNVIQVLLDGLCKCIPIVSLPPVLIKYLGRTFNAWYTGLEYLHNMVLDNKTVDVKEEDKARDSIMDSFGELLYAVAEEDLYFGLVKRRCLFTETNVAASFEQNGMWANAQHYYEAAQAKARSGVMPYTESEYSFWEEHWVACAQRLQQWDSLTDLAKHEGDADLLLECAWRLSDWISEREFLQTTVQGLPEGKGCRKKVYEAFLALQTLQNNGGDKEKAQFKNICEQGVQLALKSWLALPQQITNAHIPILHAFQQFVELQEAAQMQENLTATSAQNIETKSQELKGLLLTWRERLPNMWDDINIWSDLVAWRQHVFTTINKAYNPLISTLTQPAGSTNAASSYAYRGYHETAWIINRFSHVARKHQLMDVCISSLSKIYTLPNIEIPEAFYKLREQAKCYFQSPSEYSNGLEVINNTNLQFFSKPQTAEFFALKGVFLQKLNLHDDATQAFSSAIQISDMKLPKAWAAWGQYNDRMFRDQPNEMKFGINAVMCYLHAAGQYNNARSRKYLARLLWLLSLDDNEQSMTKTWENQKGEIPLWYWITFIPQLLTALSNKDARYARAILMKLAKSFPQALHFQLRTAKEDYMAIKKQALSTTPKEPSAGELQANGASGENKDGGAAGGNNHATPVRRQPWEYVEEVMALLKTAFPLLALSMETMVDQMAQRLKPNTDEDIFRLIVALLNDGVQQLCRDPGDVSQICQATEYNLARFAESMNPNHLKYKAAFEADFIKSKPNLSQLIMKFREWRDRLENLLYSRPRRQHLEQYSHYLIEFEYQKFDDIDVPGQYFLLKDNNKDFIRIERFMPEVDTVRGHTSCLRRITIRGHDGSLHPFLVQHPANRHCRREERILQLFRILNSVLERKKESRRRSLAFHLPVIVPLAPLVRLIQDDTSYVTLQEIFEEHCQISGLSRDDPVLFYISRLREFYLTEDVSKRGKVEMLNLKTEIMDEIGKRMIPETILSRYMYRKMATFTDLWLMRKQFTAQMAAVTYMTYVMSIGQRHPHKFHISTLTGNVWASDIQPTLSNANFLFANTESVNFRLTPNIQHFITPIGMEGPFSSNLMSIARSLVEPEHELEDYLSVFVKDELIAWQNMGKKPALQDHQLRDLVNQNVDLVVKRTNGLSCKMEREKAGEGNPVPSNQTIVDLISQAGNPLKLAQMEPTFLAML